MASEPRHAAAEAPMARTAGHDHHIEFMGPHLVAQRRIAPGIFLRRKLLPHGIAIKRRVEHVAEWPVLIEPAAHLLPWHCAGRSRDVDVHSEHPAIVARPPAAATPSAAIC